MFSELLFRDPFVTVCTAIITPIPILYRGSDETAIQPLFATVIANGGEGLMLNLKDAPYEFRRSGAIMKIKPAKSCEARIVGFNPGEGRFDGTLGSLIVDYMGTPVGVSSGLSDADRHHIWRNRASLLGAKVTIRYAEESFDAQGTASLRFPVFAGFAGKGAGAVQDAYIHPVDGGICYPPEEFERRALEIIASNRRLAGKT